MKKLLFLSLVIMGVTVYAQTPSFTPNHKIVLCGYNEVFFVCVQPQDPTIVRWDFGDGTTGIGASVSHRYTAYGIFNVKMVTEKNLTLDSVTVDSFVTVKPNPIASFTVTTGEIQKPRTRVFSSTSQHFADSFDRLEWMIGIYKDSINPVVEYTFPSKGDYTVSLKVTNNFGCEHSISKTLKVEEDGTVSEVGIEEERGNAGVTVYPNPVTQQLYVLSHTGEKITSLRITDLVGKTVMEWMGELPDEKGLDVSTLPGGTYFASFTAGDQFVNKKIFKY